VLKQKAESFDLLAPWLGALVSRSTDSVAGVREPALDAVETLLRMSLCSMCEYFM